MPWRTVAPYLSSPIRAELNGSKVGENFCDKKRLGVLWLQTVARQSSGKRQRTQCCREYVRGGQAGIDIYSAVGQQQLFLIGSCGLQHFVLTDVFFNVRAVGLFCCPMFLLRRPGIRRQTDILIDLSHKLPIQSHLR